MGVAATLAQGTATVEPGGEALYQITVRNTGTVVDQFTFEVVGDCAPWASVSPESVSLLPGAEQEVQLAFRPPRGSEVPAGEYPFAVRVVPQEDVAGSVAEEGTLHVAAFTDTTAELLPRTSRGRRGGVHELAVDNRGNVHLNARLLAADADQLLTFRVQPPGLVIDPGHAAFAKVQVRPRKRFWRGPPQTRPFQVIVEPEDGVPLAVDGTMLQEPLIPKWLPKALLALLLLIALLVALWYALLRPALEAAAEQAVEEELAAVQEEVAAAGEAAAAAQESAAAAQEAAAGAQETADGASEAAVAVSEDVAAAEEALAAQDPGLPFDFRLPPQGQRVPPGTEAIRGQLVPTGETWAITDLILQNPQGDRGMLQIRRRNNLGQVIALLEIRLDNFRDLDFHFVTPWQFAAGEQVELLVTCDNQVEGASGQPCSPAVSFSGLRSVVVPTPEPTATPDSG